MITDYSFLITMLIISRTPSGLFPQQFEDDSKNVCNYLQFMAFYKPNN